MSRSCSSCLERSQKRVHSSFSPGSEQAQIHVILSRRCSMGICSLNLLQLPRGAAKIARIIEGFLKTYQLESRVRTLSRGHDVWPRDGCCVLRKANLWDMVYFIRTKTRWSALLSFFMIPWISSVRIAVRHEFRPPSLQASIDVAYPRRPFRCYG